MQSGTIGMIRSKKDLHGHLISLREVALYDIFAQVCLHEFIKKWTAGQADPTAIVTELPEGLVNLKQFMDRLDGYGPFAARETKRNANRSTTRNLLKEGFRITKAHYQPLNDYRTLTQQPWYQFSRLLVNSLSHDFRLDFRPGDLKQLPVQYLGQTLDASMNGQSAEMPLRVLLSLYDEILAFVANDQ